MGCFVVGLLLAGPAILLAILAGIGIYSLEDRQRRRLDSVNLDLLTEPERTRWAAYRHELDTTHALGGNALADLADWLERQDPLP